MSVTLQGFSGEEIHTVLFSLLLRLHSSSQRGVFCSEHRQDARRHIFACGLCMAHRHD